MRQLNLVTEEFFLTTKSTNRPEKISWETVLLGEVIVHPMKFFRVVSVFRCKKIPLHSASLTDYTRTGHARIIFKNTFALHNLRNILFLVISILRNGIH